MKRRVLSRPGLKSLMLAWLDVSCHVPGAKTIGQAVDKTVSNHEENSFPLLRLVPASFWVLHFLVAGWHSHQLSRGSSVHKPITAGFLTSSWFSQARNLLSLHSFSYSFHLPRFLFPVLKIARFLIFFITFPRFFPGFFPRVNFW